MVVQSGDIAHAILPDLNSETGLTDKGLEIQEQLVLCARFHKVLGPFSPESH